MRLPGLSDDAPPAGVAVHLRHLGAALDRAVPPKQLDRNLLVATWRLEMFDAVRPDWDAGASGSPRCGLYGLSVLTEIARRFDIVALQGAIGAADGLRLLMDRLGSHWSLLVTGLSPNSSYQERMAFVFDTRKVLARGLAGQVVLPEGGDKGDAGAEGFLARQFFRPPLFAGFRCQDQDFTLANIHLVFGSPGERIAEIRAFAGWLRRVSAQGHRWERNLIALGQLQLLREGSAVDREFAAAGLHVPPALRGQPNFVNAQGVATSAPSTVAWFAQGDQPGRLDLACRRAGVFNLLGETLPLRADGIDRALTRHLPVWVEFDVPRPSTLGAAMTTS